MSNSQTYNFINKHIAVGRISWKLSKAYSYHKVEDQDHKNYIEEEISTFLRLILQNKDYYLNKLNSTSSLDHYADKFYININEQYILLTPRQIECLTYVSMGRSMKYIAKALNCSISNVENHLTCLKKKLRVHTTSGLIDLFWRSLL